MYTTLFCLLETPNGLASPIDYQPEALGALLASPHILILDPAHGRRRSMQAVWQRSTRAQPTVREDIPGEEVGKCPNHFPLSFTLACLILITALVTSCNHVLLALFTSMMHDPPLDISSVRRDLGLSCSPLCL